MNRLILGILLIVLVGGGSFLAYTYQIVPQHENGKVAYWKIVPRDPKATYSAPSPSSSTRPLRSSIRLATYNLGGLDALKFDQIRVSDVLTRLLPQFDLIALQGLRGKNQGVIIRLVEQINAQSGRQFAFATCPTQLRQGIEHYSAFLYDRALFDVDISTVHFVEDALGRFRHKPLVGSFRVRGVDPAQAFTFTLIAVETNPERPAMELDLLADVYKALRDDGRNEDDIIMLGDFEADENHLGNLGKILGMTALISNTPTTTRGTQLADNFLFDRIATSEFTGRAEVVDMMRAYNLTMQDAMEISDHLPVWAEFNVFEGGERGFIPQVPEPQ